MRYAWIDAHRSQFTMGERCTVLDVSISGYRAWKRGGTPDRQGLTDAQLPTLLQAIHAEMKGACGSPRMVRELRARGFSVSKPRGERLMRENGLRGRRLRAALIQILDRARPERQLVESLDVNLLVHWFVGLGMDEGMWDQSTFSERWGRHFDDAGRDAVVKITCMTCMSVKLTHRCPVP